MALDKLVDSSQLDTDLTSVANAIRTKGGTSASLAFPADFVSAIGDIPSGGGGRPEADENDVILIDFDGRILYSYTAADFASLDALPTIPTLKYSFLQQDGWNWTLADAKTYVAKYKELVIGAQYTTTDGKNHCLFEFPSPVTISFQINIANAGASSGNSITVDWGDGSTPTTETGLGRNITKTYTHTYSAKGVYDIAWSCSNINSRVLDNALFGFCKAMAFQSESIYCDYYINADIIMLSGCSKTVGNMFRNGMIFTAPIFPRNFQVTNSNSNWFTSAAVCSLKYVSWPSNPASTGNDAMSGYTYDSCRCLRRITPPADTTSLWNNTIRNCASLLRFNVTENVTAIKPNSLAGLSSLKELHFYPSTPPTVDDTTSFTGLPTTCTIYVPSGKLTDYTTATNYPDSNTYTYVEE